MSYLTELWQTANWFSQALWRRHEDTMEVVLALPKDPYWETGELDDYPDRDGMFCPIDAYYWLRWFVLFSWRR